jgi:hypothetical protein
MSKEAYFEMCEMLGQEPIEEQIPVEVQDLPELIQTCFVVYSLLADNWDPMGGNYLGKDYSLVFRLLELYDVTERSETLLCLDMLQHIDSVRSKLIADKLKARSPQS